MNHKHPRTLTEAFGPYTSDRIDEDPDPAESRMLWLAVWITVFLAFLAVLIVRLLIC